MQFWHHVFHTRIFHSCFLTVPSYQLPLFQSPPCRSRSVERRIWDLGRVRSIGSRLIERSHYTWRMVRSWLLLKIGCGGHS